jgi:CHAD domain-containing protein
MTARPADQPIRKILAELQDSLSRRLRALTRAASPATVHAARIAVRRLRVALRALKHQLDPPSRKRYLRALRQVSRDLEPLREADAREIGVNRLLGRRVMAGHTQSPQLAAVIAAQRERARQDLHRLMQAPAWKRRLARLDGYAGEPSLAAPMEAPRRVIRDILARRRRLLRRALRRIGVKPRKLHRLRLRIKDMRYLDENFGGLLKDSPDPELERLRQLQNRLGEFHDNWRLRKWLRLQDECQPIAKHLRVIIDLRQKRLLKRIARLAKEWRETDQPAPRP